MAALKTTTQDFFTSFDPTLYNQLPLVGEADALLNGQKDLAEFFKTAGELICSFNLEAYIGVGLLHKHNSVGPDQLMVESVEEIRKDRPALIMELVPKAAGDDAVPVVWKLQNSKAISPFVPLEHSTCNEAKTGYAQLMNQPEFLEKFRSLLLDFGYESILGLTVMRVQALKKQPGESYIERSHPTRTANVMTSSTQLSNVSSKLLRTSWSFKKEAGLNGALMTKCEATTNCEEPTEPGGPHIEEPGPHIEEPDRKEAAGFNG